MSRETTPSAEPEATADAVAAAERELERLRDDIELLDRDIVRLLARRVELAREVGRAKLAAQRPILDPAREAGVVRRAGELAREAGVGEEDVRYIFWHVIGLSRRAQLAE